MMNTLCDILACPVCKSTLRSGNESLACPVCGRSYPLHQGIPVFTLTEKAAWADDTFQSLEDYPSNACQNALESLDASQVILDCSGWNIARSRPNVIRFHSLLHPDVYADVVGGLTLFPFGDQVFDFVILNTTLSYSPQPFETAREIFRVCKPGAYIYADREDLRGRWLTHYFDFTVAGLREVLSDFRQLSPDVKEEEGYWGIKQWDEESIIPPPLVSVYQQRRDFQERFKIPDHLWKRDNFLRWASQVGADQEPAIGRYYQQLIPFSKDCQELSYVPGDEQSEQAVAKLPVIPTKFTALPDKVWSSWRKKGILGLARELQRYIRWWLMGRPGV